MTQYLVQDYYNAIDSAAPFRLAEHGDNSGLLAGSGEQPVRRALLALDATADVIAEAKEAGAQLIVTHHPIIYGGIKSLPGDGALYKAAQAGLSVISAHTNLDAAEGGVNDVLAGLLELRDTAVLEPSSAEYYRKIVVFVPDEALERVYLAMTEAGAGRQGNYAGAAFLSHGEGRFMPMEGASPAIGSIGALQHVNETRLEMLAKPSDSGAVLAAMRRAHPYEEPAYDVLETAFAKGITGAGRVGNTPRPFEPREFASFVCEKLKTAAVRLVAGKEPVMRAAVCGGSGGFLLARAKRAGADALLTADCKHSQLLEAAHLGITLIDAGHYATEAVVTPVLLEKLRAALPGADIRLARACTEPASIVFGSCIHE